MRTGWISDHRPVVWPLRRLLVTGSRDWTDTTTIRAALAWVWHPNTILVQGECATGADQLCKACWTAWGGGTEDWAADWDRYGGRRKGNPAGPIRNKNMVDAGADMALAFPLPRSRGTRGCVAMLAAAGIPTYVINRQKR